jgi:hypothetical protein
MCYNLRSLFRTFNSKVSLALALALQSTEPTQKVIKVSSALPPQSTENFNQYVIYIKK